MVENNCKDIAQREIDLLLENCLELLKAGDKSALSLIKKAEKLSRKLNYEKGIALSFIALARYYGSHSKYAQALDLANRGNEMAISSGDSDVQMKACYVLGYLYTNLGNLEYGLRYYLRGIELIKENKLQIDPTFLNNIGVVYYDSGQFDDALEFFQEALKVAEDTRHKIESLVLSNIADVYLIKKNTQLALEYNKRAIEVFQNNNSEGYYLGQCYSIYGLIYKELGQWEQALESFEKALAIYKESNQQYLEAEMLYNIGSLYLIQEKVEEGIDYLLRARNIASKIKTNGILKDIYMTLAETYEKKKDYKLAFNYLKSYHHLNEKIKTTELNDKLAQHMTEFKVEKAQKDAEIQRLKTEELKRKAEETTLKANALAASYEDIKIIGEIGQKITATLDIKKVLNMVYKNINKLMAADVFGICLYNNEQARIDFKILIEQGKRLPLYHIMLDNEKSYAAKCIREKKEICINDMILDNKQQLRVGATENKFKCKSIIYYPLITENKIVGAMTVQSYKSNAYSDRTIEMIKALASYIAIALNNSQKSEELRVKTNELEAISKTDVLTGIYNRRYIMSKIQEEAAAYEDVKRSFSIVIIDIDYFKSINDKYGHNCGDHILVKLSKILKANIRKQDVLSRWGGEEFLMLLPDTDEEEAVLLCERIREKIEGSNFNYDKKRIKLTVTFGVSEYNENLGVDFTINDADKALYEGKNKGRNCVVSR